MPYINMCAALVRSFSDQSSSAVRACERTTVTSLRRPVLHLAQQQSPAPFRCCSFRAGWIRCCTPSLLCYSYTRFFCFCCEHMYAYVQKDPSKPPTPCVLRNAGIGLAA